MRQLADQSGSIVNGSFGKSNITRCQRLSPQSGRFKRKIQNSIEVRSTGKASEINEQSHGTVDSSNRCWRGEIPYSPPTNPARGEQKDAMRGFILTLVVTSSGDAHQGFGHPRSPAARSGPGPQSQPVRACGTGFSQDMLVTLFRHDPHTAPICRPHPDDAHSELQPTKQPRAPVLVPISMVGESVTSTRQRFRTSRVLAYR